MQRDDYLHNGRLPLEPIWEAAMGGRWETVKEWLTLDPTLIHATDDANDEKSLLHYAVQGNENADIEVVKYLISREADVNQGDNFGHTPLHKTVDGLRSVDFRERINRVKGDMSHSAWQKTKQYREKIGKIVEYLVSQGADVNAKSHHDFTPMHSAAYTSRESLEYFVSHGGNAYAANDSGETVSHWAAIGKTAGVMEYLTSIGVTMNVRESRGQTPLHYYLFWSQDQWAPVSCDVVKCMVAHGADVCAKDKNGRTLLHEGHVIDKETLEFFISQRADINAKDNDGNTPLHRLANCRLDLLKNYVACGADIHARNKEGKAPLDLVDSKEIKQALRKS